MRLLFLPEVFHPDVSPHMVKDSTLGVYMAQSDILDSIVSVLPLGSYKSELPMEL